MRTRQFVLKDIRLTADEAGESESPPVVFLHGGGQTRHSWKSALNAVASRGFHALSVDLRGHGDSDWSRDGRYSLSDYADDIRQLCAAMPVPPVLVGASLGGLTGMALAGDRPPVIAALILVDIVPFVPEDGSDHVRDFMAAAPDGFESVDAAADAVARYLRHRERPRDHGGLAKNLRLRDGRYYWHWDPAMLIRVDSETREEVAERLYAMLRATDMPVMLVRGGLSRIVTEEGAASFLREVPRAEMVEVGGADHMVAGDSNRLFNSAVLDFLDRHRNLILGAGRGVGQVVHDRVGSAGG